MGSALRHSPGCSSILGPKLVLSWDLNLFCPGWDLSSALAVALTHEAGRADHSRREDEREGAITLGVHAVLGAIPLDKMQAISVVVDQ